MEKMKNSNIEWIGNIPQNWKEKRIKDIIIILPKSDIQAGDGEDEGKYWFYTSSQELSKRIDKCLYDGDAIIMGTGGSASVNYSSELFSTSTDCFNFKTNQYTKFVFCWLYSIKDEVINEIWFEGMGLRHLQKNDILSSHIYLPKTEEQKMIADFLENKIKKIDDILNDINNEIELLEKYRKSLITETVTKGLSKNVKMKDSGIDWIGNIPEHWSINRISNICKLKGRIGWQGLTTDEYIDEGPYLITGVDFSNGSIDWDNCEHVSEWRYNQAKDIQIKENDLLITKDGTVGKIAIVQNCPEKVTLNSGVLLIRCLNNTYINKFLYYILYSNEFWHWFEITNLGATTITHLYQNVFAKFLVAMPDKKEQQEIVRYLDKKCEEINTLIKDKQEQIEKIEQYKKSLIYEYVTGKKRVKGAEELYG